MTTDLDTRLRRYGTTLDEASDAYAAPDFDLDLDPGHATARQRRTRGLVATAGLVAAASVAFVVMVDGRDAPAPPAPASAPDAGGSVWPVRMAPGLPPWFELDGEIVASLGLQAPVPGPAQGRLQCTVWTAESGTVTCSSVTGEGYLPAITYPGTPGPDATYVDVSTLHADIDPATYATNWSQGKDVGYEDPPLPQQDVTIDGAPGRLIETPTGIRRVTWSPQPGVLVAVETGPGLSRDDLLTIAPRVTPTRATPPVPLVLATTDIDVDGLGVIALGGVVDGEVCLTTPSGCVSVADVSSPGSVGRSQIATVRTDFGLAGIATGDIATVRFTTMDNTSTDITPIGQPTGTTRAFAIVTAEPVGITALDAVGNVVDTNVIEDASPQTAPPTTVSSGAASPTPTAPPGVFEGLEPGLSIRYVSGVEGVNLFVVERDDMSTGVVATIGTAYAAGTFDEETIASGRAHLYRAGSPTVAAGIVPDGVIDVTVDGASVPIVDSAWLAVLDAPASSLTVTFADGRSETVDLLAPPMTAPATTPG